MSEAVAARYTGFGHRRAACARVLRRHAYLILKSPTRIVSMMYYPTVTMIVWALLTLYLAPTNNFLKDAPGFFIGAVLLWDVLFRGQLGVSLTFIEEFYARNLGNLFVSPLTLPEYIVGQLAISVLRALIGVGGACLFAYLLFRFSIFSLGPSADCVLREPAGVRLGHRPRDVGRDPAPRSFRRGARLGGDLHHRAGVGRLLSRRACCRRGCSRSSLALPSAHVFEGMRALLLDGVFRWDHFWAAAALNVVYLALGAAAFAWAMRDARHRGTLLQMGE